MKELENLRKLIGNTPLVKINYSFKGLEKCLYAKLEWYGLSGSIKDRAAYEMIKRAYLTGTLKRGQTICETTSGNMGIAICAAANCIGNPVIICMPKSMSLERRQLLKLLGAKLELTENFPSAFQRAEEYGRAGVFLTRQFENYDNLRANYFTTGREIAEKLNFVPCFVSGVGTGGTLMGAGGYLKKKRYAKIFAVDPAESGILTYKKSLGEHKIQGLGDGIIPKLYNESLVDEVIPVKSDDAIAMAKKLSNKLGLPAGISSGANVLGCALSGVDGAATVFADDSKKYLSTELTGNIKSELVDEIELKNYEVI